MSGFLLLLTAFAIFLLILYLRQRVGAAAVKPIGKDGVMLTERLSEKRRWVAWKEKHGIVVGVGLTVGAMAACGWMCGG